MPADFLADAPLTKSLAQANATLDAWDMAKNATPANWQPPILWDSETQRWRPATQDDVNRLVSLNDRLLIIIDGMKRAFRDAGGNATLPL